MNKRLLGSTGIELSEVGYGAAALFGKDVLGKQGISEEQAYNLISSAISAGVTFFDTGINYGYAEERLGRCVSEAISRGLTQRKNLVIETKCGETINSDGTYGAMDWSPDWIKKSLEISLKRLQLEYVDLFAIHGECEKQYIDPLITTFQDMKRQGLIRAYGVNTFDTDFLSWVAEEKCFDYVMLDYNIVRQDREPLIEMITDAGVAVIAGSAMGESLYSKKIFKVKNRNDFWYLARALVRFRGLLNKSKDFKFLMKQDGYTANQLALRYVLDNKRITSAVFSTINTEHLVSNLKAVNITMSENIREEIKKRA